MKNGSIFLIMLCLMATKATNGQAVNRLPILDKTGIGVLELGMPIEDIYKYVDHDQIYKVYTYNAAGKKTSYQIYAADGKTMTFSADIACKGKKCYVTRINVWHKAYPTTRNVRVGETYKQIRENYRVQRIFWEDGNLIVQTMARIYFYIDTSTLPDNYADHQRFLSLPDHAGILALMVQN